MTAGRMDGWTAGRLDGWTGGRVDGWTAGNGGNGWLVASVDLYGVGMDDTYLRRRGCHGVLGGMRQFQFL